VNTRRLSEKKKIKHGNNGEICSRVSKTSSLSSSSSFHSAVHKGDKEFDSRVATQRERERGVRREEEERRRRGGEGL